jgi:hypothetical protein
MRGDARRRAIRVATSSFVLLVALAANSRAGNEANTACHENPTLVGKCFTVHGRLATKNGGPAMPLWVTGTHRLLGVMECWHDPNHCSALPDNVAFARDYPPGELLTYGDFVVCPFTQSRPGWMQFVCVDKASRLVVEQLNQKSQTFEYVTGPRDTILKSDLKPFP